MVSNNIEIEPIMERNELMLLLANSIIVPWIFLRSRTHIEMPESTQKLIKNDNKPIMYVGLHKSLWEVFGIPYAILMKGGSTPYGVSGDNLIKGDIEKHLARGIGVTFLHRGSKMHSGSLNAELNYILMTGKNVMYFAEPGRSKDGRPKPFQTTGLQSIIDVASEKESYVILANTDYSDVNWKGERLLMKSKTPYTFRAEHIIGWLKHMEDIYISFSEPILINPDDDRKILAPRFRKQAMDMVKIQRINIFSEAMVRMLNNNQRGHGKLCETIETVLDEVSIYKDKFRGFDQKTTPEEFINNSSIYPGKFRGFNSKDKVVDMVDILMNKDLLPVYQLYAGYIAHYFNNKS